MLHSRCITGLVLSGGQGSRMDGRDKGLESLHGKPLVRHAIDRLRPQVHRVLISANRNIAIYRSFDADVIEDAELDGEIHAGPLVGLAAALAGCGTGYLVTVPCDAPFFPLDLVERLRHASVAQEDLPAIAMTRGHRQPLFAFMRSDVRDALNNFLKTGDRKAMRWWESIGAIEVNFDDELDAFLNINSPADLAGAMRRRS